MREGWTYKKLGEVCDLYQPKTISSDMLVSDGDYPVYGANGIIGRYNQYNHEAAEVLVTCRGATCGTINISTPFSWINGNAMVIHPNNENLNKAFLAYALRGIDLSDVITGAAQPQITRQTLSPKKLPLPPFSEQQRIVSELDLLSSILEKKKEQIKAYDQLAQSIFYDMFGDPIDNPKGWEVKKLGEVCDRITDGTHNSPINTEKGDFMYVTAKNIKKDGIVLDNITYVSADVHKTIFERCNPQYGDVLYIKDGITTGIATINTLKEEFSLLSSVALLKPKGCLVNYYLKAVLNMPSQYASIRENMGGAAITRLTITKINVIKIPLPPLSLQQSFAEKIEAIEAQKTLIQQSIAETQTMFDSRMDYWFN